MRRPYAGCVLLVVGAGDAMAREVALRAAALGADVIAAGPTLAPVLVTAGLIASTGGVVRVVEAAVPPLLGAPLVVAAGATLAPPTHAVVAQGAFADPADAARAASGLAASLGAGNVVTAAARAPEGPRAAAKTTLAALFHAPSTGDPLLRG